MDKHTTFKLNQEWSEAVFAQEDAMTRDEFCNYASDMIYGEGAECLHERISEIQGEINMFGDSGPGSMFHLRRSIDEHNQISRMYLQLTGVEAPILRMPSYRY